MMTEITFNSLPQAVTEVYSKLEAIERLLLNRSNEPQPVPDELLTVQQAAALLSLSVPTIYGLTMKAMIPVSKRGKRLYFSKHELLDWIAAGRKKTRAETAMEAAQINRRSR